MQNLINKVDKLIEDYSKEIGLPNSQFEGILPAQYIDALNLKLNPSEKELQGQRKKFVVYKEVLFFEGKNIDIYIKSY